MDSYLSNGLTFLTLFGRRRFNVEFDDELQLVRISDAVLPKFEHVAMLSWLDDVCPFCVTETEEYNCYQILFRGNIGEIFESE